MAPLSETQEIIAIAITIVPSVLSMLGSSIIIYLCTRGVSRKKTTVYTRILIGMSTMDIINTTSWLFQPFLLPQTGGRVWAHGNDHTCAALGFFQQLGTSVAIYSGFLACYFLMTVYFGVSEKFLKRRVERAFHCISILFPLISAVIGAAFGRYGELELGFLCWLADPKSCRDDPDATCPIDPVRWIVSGAPFLLVLLFQVVTYCMIVFKVRRTLIHSNRHAFTPQRADPITRRESIVYSSSGAFNRDHGGADSATALAKRQVRDVAWQSTFYIVASLNTIVWITCLRIVDGPMFGKVYREDESQWYWLVLLTQVFYPCQGFWNFLIFLRPRYVRKRRLFVDNTRLWCFRESLKPPAASSSCSFQPARLADNQDTGDPDDRRVQDNHDEDMLASRHESKKENPTWESSEDFADAVSVPGRGHVYGAHHTPPNHPYALTA